MILAVLAVAGAGCVTLPGSDRGVIRAKNRVAPALVHVRPVKEVFAGGKREQLVVSGSGFIISRDGYVVTNEHVAGQSELVRCVLFNKTEVDAEVVGTDKYTDIAVLKLKGDWGRLPTVRLGRSKGLQAGQTVLALGSPHGLARSVSQGIVSVTDRYLADSRDMVSPYNTWIQTDAAINQGNSGGPLVNLRGEVIGVNARKLGGADNVGFAIPIDIAEEVVNAIIKEGRVRRSWIGLNLQEMTRRTSEPGIPGVVAADVDPMSPASEAGLLAGDILLAVNDRPTNARFAEDLPAVRKSIADLPVGEPAVLRVSRGDDEIDITVTTAEKSDLRGNEIELEGWGFTVSELTPAIVRIARLPSSKGVLVSGAQVGGIAANARLKQGDIILNVDGEDVENLASFKRMAEDRIESRQRLVLMDVKHGALTRFVVLEQDGDMDSEEVSEGQGPEGSSSNDDE
jgi:serine protease Do